MWRNEWRGVLHHLFGNTKRIIERILRSRVQRVLYALTLVMSSYALIGRMNKNRLIVHKLNLGKPEIFATLDVRKM